MGRQIPVKALVLVVSSSLAITTLSFAQSGGDDGTAVMNTLTFHVDRQRTGWNRMESVLTPANVADPRFGPLWDEPSGDYGLPRE